MLYTISFYLIKKINILHLNVFSLKITSLFKLYKNTGWSKIEIHGIRGLNWTSDVSIDDITFTDGECSEFV